jgi:hypothetical protein
MIRRLFAVLLMSVMLVVGLGSAADAGELCVRAPMVSTSWFCIPTS